MMDLGNQILRIRKDNHFTQEEFGQLFHVTRQTVSNWENKKSYPDLQTLIEISNRFDVSMDMLLKGDEKMVRKIDKERLLGQAKRERSIIDFFTGSGTGIVASCLFSPNSSTRTITILVGFTLISIGGSKKHSMIKKCYSILKIVMPPINSGKHKANHRKHQKVHSGIVSGRQGPERARTLARR